MSKQIMQSGIMDASRRIAAVILDKPVAKNTIRTLLNNADPENAPALVRELLWHDPELTFSVAAALPKIANCVIRGAETLTTEVGRFPPDLKRQFASQILGDIDHEALGRTLANLKGILDDLSPVLEKFKEGSTDSHMASKETSMHQEAQYPTGESVLEEVLKTPFIKDILRDYLNNIDPATGSRTVRTLLWQDPEQVFSLAGAIPAMLNAFICAFSETGRQLSAFPPGLVNTLAAKVGADLDLETFQKGRAEWAGVIGGILKEHPTLTDPDTLADILGKGITAGAQRLQELHRQQPQLIEQFVARMLANVDRRAIEQAAAALLTAILNQRFPIASWGLKQIIQRIRFRLRGKRT